MRLKIKNKDRIVGMMVGYKDWQVTSVSESNQLYVFTCMCYEHGNTEILKLNRNSVNNRNPGQLLWKFEEGPNPVPYLVSKDWITDPGNILKSLSGLIQERREMSI